LFNALFYITSHIKKGRLWPVVSVLLLSVRRREGEESKRQATTGFFVSRQPPNIVKVGKNKLFLGDLFSLKNDEVVMSKENCKCGKLAMHVFYEKGIRVCQCCKCYVNGGNAPADWHPECMKAYMKTKTSTPTGGDKKPQASKVLNLSKAQKACFDIPDTLKIYGGIRV
jgi:hypothetical protein